ncbi:L-rhamnose mutarotase [Leifsonia sp. NPDC058292]|uniref:L-rhamnose mutarotase n=1 Tax=Leifsonia sp. NPDC058292 TaxID=3346428 RepID=UPI0036D87E17
MSADRAAGEAGAGEAGAGGGTELQRVCFTLRVRPGLIDEYRRAHEAVWPEMLREIAASGRRNYSLFLAADGLLVGYYETRSPDAATRYLAESPVAAEWERAMSRFFVSIEGRADQDAPQLAEVFNLELQVGELV